MSRALDDDSEPALEPDDDPIEQGYYEEAQCACGRYFMAYYPSHDARFPINTQCYCCRD